MWYGGYGPDCSGLNEFGGPPYGGTLLGGYGALPYIPESERGTTAPVVVLGGIVAAGFLAEP